MGSAIPRHGLTCDICPPYAARIGNIYRSSLRVEPGAYDVRRSFGLHLPHVSPLQGRLIMPGLVPVIVDPCAAFFFCRGDIVPYKDLAIFVFHAD